MWKKAREAATAMSAPAWEPRTPGSVNGLQLCIYVVAVSNHEVMAHADFRCAHWQLPARRSSFSGAMVAPSQAPGETRQLACAELDLKVEQKLSCAEIGCQLLLSPAVSALEH